MGIFHGYVSHNQMVKPVLGISGNPLKHRSEPRANTKRWQPQVKGTQEPGSTTCAAWFGRNSMANHE